MKSQHTMYWQMLLTHYVHLYAFYYISFFIYLRDIRYMLGHSTAQVSSFCCTSYRMPEMSVSGTLLSQKSRTQFVFPAGVVRSEYLCVSVASWNVGVISSVNHLHQGLPTTFILLFWFFFFLFPETQHSCSWWWKSPSLNSVSSSYHLN